MSPQSARWLDQRLDCSATKVEATPAPLILPTPRSRASFKLGFRLGCLLDVFAGHIMTPLAQVIFSGR
jgi:hypothetical protein